ncbi:MAG: signal peptidase I [Ktedonobacterales bacterium]
MAKKRSPAPTRLASDKRAHVMREVVETLLFVGLIFLIVHVAIVPVGVEDGSMEPHLFPGQYLIVNHAAYLLSGPSRGDVVVYYNPQNGSDEYIGRVIAIPGDTISVSLSTVTVDGTVLNETYVQPTAGGQLNTGVVPTTKLGPNQYYVMFDNRQYSNNDSRTFGPLQRQNIVGRAVLVFWPLSQLGGISDYSDVFQNVH